MENVFDKVSVEHFAASILYTVFSISENFLTTLPSLVDVDSMFHGSNLFLEELSEVLHVFFLLFTSFLRFLFVVLANAAC